MQVWNWDSPPPQMGSEMPERGLRSQWSRILEQILDFFGAIQMISCRE